MGQVKAPQCSEQALGGQNEKLGRFFSLTEFLNTDKVRKISSLKRVNEAIRRNLGAACGAIWPLEELFETVNRLHACGLWIKLGASLKSGKVHLLKGNFCDKHLLCPPCAAARSRRLLERYIPAFLDQQKAGMQHYMLTLTWPPPVRRLGVLIERAGLRREACPGADMAACIEIEALIDSVKLGFDAFGKLWDQRRRKKDKGPFAAVAGIVLALEVSRDESKGARDWHPHFHCLVTMPKGQRVDARKLRKAWVDLTGGNQLQLDPVRSGADLVEVLKYAIKPLEIEDKGIVNQTALKWRFLASQGLKGLRLVRSKGCYLGIDSEPNLDDSEAPVDDDMIEFILRWCSQLGLYQLG